MNPGRSHTTAHHRQTQSKQDAMDTLQDMQAVLDDHKEALGDGAYLRLSDGLKQLHSVTKLFIITYGEFAAETSDDGAGPSVSFRTKTRIMRKGDAPDRTNWSQVFYRNELPADHTNLKLHDPFHSGNKVIVVFSVEPYLKRGRDDETA